MSRSMNPKGGDDRVMTPSPLARKIVDHFAPSGSILEPCQGDGAFTDAMMGYGAVFSCEIEDGRDFFGFESKVDWVITNCPYSQFRQFLIRSMELAENVVFLAPLNHFVTKARMRDIKKAGFGFVESLLVDTPPKPWPQSGFQIAAVYLRRGYIGPMKFTTLTP